MIRCKENYDTSFSHLDDKNLSRAFWASDFPSLETVEVKLMQSIEDSVPVSEATISFRICFKRSISGWENLDTCLENVQWSIKYFSS